MNSSQQWVTIYNFDFLTNGESGYFQLEIDVPPQYPLAPPTVKFVTKIFHPNVHFKTGEICLDLLKTAWSAV